MAEDDQVISSADADSDSTVKPGPGPGEKCLPVPGIIFLSAYLVGAIALCLYGLVVLWPVPTPSGEQPPGQRFRNTYAADRFSNANANADSDSNSNSNSNFNSGVGPSIRTD
jgi:hypothetical protein